MNSLQKVLFIFVVLVSNLAFGQAWVSTHKWSDTPPGQPAGTTYEDLYTKYMNYGPTVDMFANGKHGFTGQPVCDKAAALIRCDWASKNGVPCIMKAANINSNTFRCSPGDNKDLCVTHFMDKVNHVTLSSISRDTYPVKLNRDNVKGGTIFLVLDGADSHTYTVQSVDSTGRIKTIYGTDETDKIKDGRTNFIFTGSGLNTDFGHPFTKGQDGFRRWRTYDDDRKVEDEPGYDAYQQFETDGVDSTGKTHFVIEGDKYNSWAEAAVARIKLYSGTVSEYLDSVENELCNQVQVNRLTVVSRGEAYRESKLRFNPNYRIAEGSQDYNDSSTEIRDNRLQSDFQDLKDQLDDLKQDPDYETMLKKKNDIFNQCGFNYGPKPYQLMTLSKFEKIILSGNISNNPNASLDDKWGNTQNDVVDSLAAYQEKYANTSAH